MRIDVLGDVWHRSKKALTLLLRSKATTNWRKEGSGNKIFGENRHAAYDHKGYSQIQSTGRKGEGRIFEVSLVWGRRRRRDLATDSC